jgi:hypothetical protein
MHLEMICQAARDEYSPRAGELDKRRAALVAFIMGATCLADDSDRELATKVNEAVNGHFSKMNETAAPTEDAA